MSRRRVWILDVQCPKNPKTHIQSFREADFEERIYRYNHGIHKAFGHQPVSLVILADLNEHWRPQEYVHEELGCETRFRFLAGFPVCG